MGHNTIENQREAYEKRRSGKLLIVSKLNPSFIMQSSAESDWPGGMNPIPLCFGYEDRTMYLHSAPDGKKNLMLKKNPRCCFEVDQCDNIVRGERSCAWRLRYRSVIGFGRVCFIEDCEGKNKGLNCIMRHYRDEPVPVF